MKDDKSLNQADHDNMDSFLGHVLDDYKNGVITKEQATSGIAHVISAVNNGEYHEARMWLAQGRALIRQ